MTYHTNVVPSPPVVPDGILDTQVRPIGGDEAPSEPQDQERHSEIPAPGTVLGERYVVDSVLGEGGMGVVCVGRHLELGQRVAIKFLRSDISKRPNVAARFLDEGRAAASLHSEHVVRVMDVGQLASGLPYLVMEHLEGTDLEALAELEGPLDVDCALDYVTQVCSALSEAHEKQLIHRDIKPENLFLVESAGRTLVKVLDFGLAKRINSSRLVGLTGPQDSIGSPYYMSPEQIVTPQQVDARTDIWSLGVVLYRFVTGKVPFQGDTLVEVFAHVINAEAESIRAVRPELDEELDRIVRRCLEKDVEKRYQSIKELAEDLHQYVTLRQQHGSSIPPAALVDPPLADTTADESPIKIPGVRSRVPAMTALALLLTATAVYGAGRMGRLHVPAIAEQAMQAFRNKDGAPARRDGTFVLSLVSEADEPLRTPFWPVLLGPASGTYAREPALDGAGMEDVTTIRAERERESAPTEASDAVDVATAQERVAAYRRYLDQNGMVPIRKALETMHDNPYPE